MGRRRERGKGRLLLSLFSTLSSPLLISRLIAYENGHKLDFVHLSLLVKTLGSLIPSQRVYRFRRKNTESDPQWGWFGSGVGLGVELRLRHQAPR